MAGEILRLEGVTRDFNDAGKTIHALKKTDFSVKAGEFVAVIGPSGSGKSTFLTIAGGLQNPTSGKVFINGTEITNLSLKNLSKVRLQSVGFILQASNLVPFLTVEKQLLFIDKVMHRQSDRKAIENLFETLGIAKLKAKYPSELSGGERQRAAIAKVLYGSSDLILADEPTASLDTKKAFEVVKLLADETHNLGKATIMVTHDERLLEYCDAVYEMRDGELTRRAAPNAKIARSKKIML